MKWPLFDLTEGRGQRRQQRPRNLGARDPVHREQRQAGIADADAAAAVVAELRGLGNGSWSLKDWHDIVDASATKARNLSAADNSDNSLLRS